jgi:hypothetical protein
MKNTKLVIAAAVVLGVAAYLIGVPFRHTELVALIVLIVVLAITW